MIETCSEVIMRSWEGCTLHCTLRWQHIRSNVDYLKGRLRDFWLLICPGSALILETKTFQCCVKHLLTSQGEVSYCNAFLASKKKQNKVQVCSCVRKQVWVCRFRIILPSSASRIFCPALPPTNIMSSSSPQKAFKTGCDWLTSTFRKWV